MILEFWTVPYVNETLESLIKILLVYGPHKNKRDKNLLDAKRKKAYIMRKWIIFQGVKHLQSLYYEKMDKLKELSTEVPEKLPWGEGLSYNLLSTQKEAELMSEVLNKLMLR